MDKPPPTAAEDTERAPLLLHSLSHLREVWLPVLDAAGVRSITEIGSETGVTTELLADWLGDRDGSLVTIDPAPAPPLEALEEAGRVELVRELSPAALEGRPVSDAYLLDGDHNYHVLTRELATIADAVGDDGTFPLMIFHDVGWPWGRRDLYYDPGHLPEGAVHPHTWERGVRPGNPGVSTGGFRGEGEFAWALEEGGPRNGVLTAIEDFMAARGGLKLVTVPSVFGLGVLYPTGATYARKVTALLAAYDRHPLLARLERNRIQLFLRVVDLQDEATALRDRLAELRRATDRQEAVATRRAARAEARELALRAETVDLAAQLRTARAELDAARAPEPAAGDRVRRRARGLLGRVRAAVRRVLASMG